MLAGDLTLANLAEAVATSEIEEAIDNDGKNKAAQELGRKGGKVRAEKMTPERRAEIARKAARAEGRAATSQDGEE